MPRNKRHSGVDLWKQNWIPVEYNWIHDEEKYTTRREDAFGVVRPISIGSRSEKTILYAAHVVKNGRTFRAGYSYQSLSNAMKWVEETINGYYGGIIFVEGTKKGNEVEVCRSCGCNLEEGSRQGMCDSCFQDRMYQGLKQTEDDDLRFTDYPEADDYLE